MNIKKQIVAGMLSGALLPVTSFSQVETLQWQGADMAEPAPVKGVQKVETVTKIGAGEHIFAKAKTSGSQTQWGIAKRSEQDQITATGTKVHIAGINKIPSPVETETIGVVEQEQRIVGAEVNQYESAVTWLMSFVDGTAQETDSKATSHQTSPGLGDLAQKNGVKARAGLQGVAVGPWPTSHSYDLLTGNFVTRLQQTINVSNILDLFNI